MPDVTCNYCGGKDFYKEAGFYFCSECQAQTQEIREQEFDQPDETLIVHKTKKIKSSNSSTKESKFEQITSWECYNYILLGLVNELIALGASETIKPIVQTIWFDYLKSIEVLHVDIAKSPRLPAYNHKYDAKIIYGRVDKKKVYKRKRRASSSSASETESSVSKREHAKLKRAMAKAAYETQSNQLSDSESIMDMSLGSLKSSDSTKLKDNLLHFNRSATSELLAHMSRSHLKQHIQDTDVDLTCHKFKYREVSTKYKTGACVLTQSKLYSILYLALLINKEDIQLGDMIRFMSEGSLSYNHYRHFFPEDIDNQNFIDKLVTSKVNKHLHYRETTGKLAAHLQITKDIPMLNLVGLVRRYCKELNLSNDICKVAINLIAEIKPEMKMQGVVIPNYEAKAMCVIIFVLKLFFGLDGVTEFKFGCLASEIIGLDHGNMFIFELWLKTICYRRLVLARHHYPTQFSLKQFSCKEYLQFINTYHATLDVQRREDMDYDVISRLLAYGESKTYEKTQFYPSLTPLTDNLKVLYENGRLQQENYMLNLLLLNVQETSIDFLINSNQFLSSAKEIEIVDHGANIDLKVVPIYHTTRPYHKLKSLITCKLSTERGPKKKVPNVKLCDEIDTDVVLRTFERFHKRPKKKTLVNKKGFSLNEYSKHYCPERRFWLRLGTDIQNMRADEFDTFLGTLPHSFRLILTECASITSQSVKDLIVEYNYFETYVCYTHDLYDGRPNKSKLKDESLRRLLRRAEQHW